MKREFKSLSMMKLKYIKFKKKLVKMYTLETINSLGDPFDLPHDEYADMKA